MTVSSDEVRFEMIEGQILPDLPEDQQEDAEIDDPPVAPEVPSAMLARSLRRLRQRQTRLRAD